MTTRTLPGITRAMLIPRPSRSGAALPAGLIGRWEGVDAQTRPVLIEITSDGFWRVFSAFRDVRFAAGGAGMVWEPESYTRIYGAGEVVVGVWREDGTTIEYSFRPNGTFSIAEAGEVDLFGVYELENGQMRTGEVRATVSVDGDELVYDVVYGGVFRQNFTLSGDTLNLGGTLTLTRVPGPSAPVAEKEPQLIYKIFRAEEWQNLRTQGVTAGAPIDVQDGYIHFSTAEQAAETAAKHFAGEEDLFLIAVDAEALADDLKWEPSRGGALFPHLYREMRLGDVHWAQPLPLVDGVHQFPAGLT